MLTPAQAVKNALATTRNAVGMCDRQVASYYGYSSSGYVTAAAHWAAIPNTEKHPRDMNPPAGALVFWTGGSAGAGHVALSLGNGNVVSTDYPRSGITSTTTIDSISNGWGETYAGWSVPVFQGQVSNASFPASPSSGLGNLLGGGTILDALTGGFGTDIKDLLERLSLFLLGGILITLGVLNMRSKSIKGVIEGQAKKYKKGKKDAADDEGSEAETETGE